MWVYELATLRFLAVNTAAITHYGYSEAEFLAMTIADIRPPEELPRLHANLRQPPRAAIEKSGVWRHRKKDGTPIDVEVSSHPLHFGGRDCKFVLAHDVTERLQGQQKIVRLNRIYAVLSGINSTIVRTRERAQLFRAACRIATEEGEFVTACIALLDPRSGDAAIVAQAGADTRLLTATSLTARAGTPDSEWPASRALRERRPVICNDVGADPQLAPLLGDGERCRALAAFPLLVEQRVAGVLLLFAAAADYFDEAELRLLGELAQDVAFALQVIERDDERKHVAERLRESEAGLRRAQLTNRSAHVVTRPDGSFESWSDTLPVLIGVAPGAMPPDTRRWLAVLHPDDRAAFRNACIDAARSGARTDISYRLRRGDGALVQFRQTMEPLPDLLVPEGQARWFNTIQDITEQTQQQERLARLSRIYAVSSGINSAIARIPVRDELLQEACRVAVHDGAFRMAWIGVIDPDTLDGTVVASYGGEPGLAENIRLTAHPDSAATPEGQRPACTAVRERRPVVCNDIAADPVLSGLSGDLPALGYRAVAALPLVRNGAAVAVLVLLTDVVGFFDASELKLLDDLVGDLNFALQFIDNARRLSYLAYYDALTGLANGKLFDDRVTQFIQAARPEQPGVAVILLNVDRFAQFNDALGRRAGDAVLVQIAHRLDASLQGGYSLARIGGATFAIAAAELRDAADAAQLLERDIFAPLAGPFQLEPQEVPISVRAGLALFPADGQSAETLFKHAEVALKNAKASGERYLYYAPAMNAAHAARLELEHELRRALEADEFEVYYQPRVDLANGRIVSAEALIRWRHPQRGLVSPAIFIPLAEETGLVVPIGDWVLGSVCAQQARWLAQGAALVPVAVNLSAVQFKNGKVLQSIRDALAAHGLEARHLEFELTESMVMNDPEQAIHNLKALKALGSKLALDDFGTGYSSLAYLQRFPFDVVKIDRAFVTDLTNNPGNAAIATAVIALAHSLGLRVVAEGVETEGQLQFLRNRHCDEIQGYYFSPPVPAAQFAAMLAEGKQLPAPSESVAAETLLIVDDEPNNLASLNRLFRREGYRVLIAPGGQQGLALLAVNSVQVIISDQRMPGMSGSEFLGIVKELYPDTIRIMLSGYTDLESVTTSVNQGAVFKFMTKPWDDDELRAIIRDAFRRYRS